MTIAAHELVVRILVEGSTISIRVVWMRCLEVSGTANAATVRKATVWTAAATIR